MMPEIATCPLKMDTDKMRPDVSILVVGFNSSSYLETCLASVGRAITRFTHEILFVNNGTDTSEGLLKARFPPARVLPSRGNIGFAAANNYLAENAEGSWLLLLNPDTELQPNAVDMLLDAAIRHPQYQVLGGVTVGSDNRPAQSTQVELLSFATILRRMFGRASPKASTQLDNGLTELDALTGGFMMVERSCWRALGGLDPSFFLYAEELDFFKRLKDRGGRVAQVEASRMYHDIGSGEVFSAARMQFKMTGRAHYLHKHFSAPYAYACVFLIWASLALRYGAGRAMAWKSERYAYKADAFAKLVRTPRVWMRGYNSPDADPRTRSDFVRIAASEVPSEQPR